MKQGLSQSVARREALIELGGIEQVKERVRAVHAGRFVEDLARDIRHSLRQLRRNPGFTAVAALTLALGIGGTTAIFSVVNGVLLKPLPYSQPGRLVEVGLDLPGINQFNWPLSPAEYFAFREQSRTFQDIGLYYTGFGGNLYSANVTGLGRPEHVPALGVTDGVLPILEVTPLFGRLFTRADDQPGSSDVVMITYGYWRSKFGGDRSVIGKTIDIDSKPSTIIGVLPQRFRFLDMTNLGILLPLRPRTQRGYNYFAVARLKPGVTPAEANADVARMIPIQLERFPEAAKFFKEARIVPNLQPLKQYVIGDVGKVLWILMGGIGLVLLIACANVANLLSVRVEGRQQELAIRAALGGSRGRIAGGLLIESLVLALIGGALGLLFAYGSLRVLIALAPSDLPRLSDIGIDRLVLLFTLGVTMVAGLLFGSMLPLRYAGVRAGTGLRETGRSVSASRERHRARSALVVIQVGLALVLLVSSGLMIRTFQALIQVQPGFTAPAEVETFHVHFPPEMIKNPERLVRMDQAILDNIEAIPGVSSADFSGAVPMDAGAESDPVLVKDHMLQGQLPPARRCFWVSPSFFRTMGISIVAGRDLTWNDILNKRPVALVSENLAREYWRNPSDALGKQIGGSPKDWRQIVGVVGNVHDDGISQKAPATVYWPITDADVFLGSPAFAIRSGRAGTQSLMNGVQRAVWSVDRDLPLYQVHTLDYYYSKSMARTSFTLAMLALAGGMALLLGIVGLYGVIAYSVSQRTHEIGIRMALGAQKRDVLKLVVSGGMSSTMIGVGVGVAGAVALTRFLSSLLYGVKPTDPLTFAVVSFVLTGIALLACYIPARRATKADPIVALRYE
ncbi:MAG: ABC transporter permease [Acidobacteriaceae bacterium]|nr:ABC transporter permease [Acidobacteriaceae bacterium]